MNYREIMLRLNNALNSIDSAYAVIAKKHSLTFNALMMICFLDTSEHITQKQICNVLHLPKSTVHSILLEFMKQGYITLVAGSNKKEKFVVFTDAGKKAFSKILKETQCFEDKILCALGDNVCTMLVETAEHLGKIITKEIAEMNAEEV